MRYATSHQKEISGAIAGETSSTSTRFQITNLISSHLHYLPFASRFPLPHFTNFPFYSPLFFVRHFLVRSVFECDLVCFTWLLWLVPPLLFVLLRMKFLILIKGEGRV